MNIALEMSRVRCRYSTGISEGKAGFRASRHDGETDRVGDDCQRHYTDNPDGREPEEFGQKRFGLSQW
jgi:hypothetical protein